MKKILTLLTCMFLLITCTGCNLEATKNAKASTLINTEAKTAYENGVTASVKLGNPKISHQEGVSYLLIELEADEINENTNSERPPVNLSLVIDRSGSMSGQKIESVKNALYEIATMLNSKDRVMLTVYDDSVQTIYSANNFNKEEFISTVRGIYDGGSTYLEGGLKEGIKNINNNFQTANNTEYLNRVILLSDGMANEGISDPHGLGKIAREASEKNITISTIGVGANYDENIMTKIAEQGRGNYYFLENSKDAERIFSEELNTVLTTVAKNIEVKFNLTTPFKISQAIGYDLESDEYFKPRNLYSGRNVKYLFEVEIKPEVSSYDLEQILQMAIIEITFDDQNENSHNMQIPIHTIITKKQVESLIDETVFEEYMKSDIAQKLWEMDKNLEAIENDEARSVNAENLQKAIEANKMLNGKLDNEVEKLEKNQDYLESIGNEDVQNSSEGKIFKKENQKDAFSKTKQK